MTKVLNLRAFVVLLAIYANKISLISDETYGRDYEEEEQMEVIREEALSDGIKSQAKDKRINSKEEMELTKALPVIDPKPCNDEHPIAVFIHSAARLSGKYFERRVDSRNTWVSDVKKLNISVYFVLALNTNSSIDEGLRKESEENKDIIQFSFKDNYYNLTLKAVSLLRWIDRKCRNAEYILKTDDDLLVDIIQVINSLIDLEKYAFHGYLAYNGVMRNPRSNYRQSIIELISLIIN